MLINVFNLLSLTILTQYLHKSNSIFINKVYNSCKTRIEKFTKIEEVKSALSNENSKLLTIIYNITEIKPKKNQHLISEVRHDTNLFKTPAEMYLKLPKCCAYREVNMVH